MDIESLTDAALEKLWDQGFGVLDQREQLLVTIWGLEADVNNGGFDQYYFNSYGDFAQHLSRSASSHWSKSRRRTGSETVFIRLHRTTCRDPQLHPKGRAPWPST